MIEVLHDDKAYLGCKCDYISPRINPIYATYFTKD